MNTIELTPFPAHPDVAQYRKQAKELVRACRSRDSKALERLKSFHPHPGNFVFTDPKFILGDAQAVIAREHGFLSWPKFVRFIENANRANSRVSDFERAADAIVGGDAETLRSLLRAKPGLIRAKSERVHRCMLIHYVGANGFENFRQKTPRNAVEILRILLDAGAEVDAPADVYGRSTTLGLVATSVHPVTAGVQFDLLEMLIDVGANVNGIPETRLVAIACLHNGRGLTAAFLADHGADLNLESAAGVGRLDRVRTYFEPDGSLKAHATRKQLVDGFKWACEYGHNDVVNFLIDRGVDLADGAGKGMTGLHWAIVGGQLETVKRLIARGSPMEALNGYGGTALGQTIWCAENDRLGTDYRPIIASLLEAGARTDAYPEMKARLEAVLF